MEGAARRATGKHEGDITLAWHVAALSGAAQAGKLKPLAKYLSQRPQRAQTPAEMLEVLRSLHMRGAPMNISKAN